MTGSSAKSRNLISKCFKVTEVPFFAGKKKKKEERKKEREPKGPREKHGVLPPPRFSLLSPPWSGGTRSSEGGG